ncbi:MAG: DUF1330 domain-containing protein [Bacteroidota bacterium]
MEAYIEATQDTGKRFYQAFHDKGKVVMLNLLKFKPVANYRQFPHLQPKQEISGWEAYQLYMDATIPLLEKAGSKVLFFGKSRHFLIGPEAEQWDTVILVEHPSVARFMAFAQDEDYLQTVGHRTAALADSRLLPITQK